MSSASEQIVITGIGLMSPIGIGVDSAWDSLLNGQCGFRPVEHLSYVGTPDCIGGEVTDFTDSSAKKQHLKAVRKQIKVMCREIQLGVASALQAITHAGVDLDAVSSDRIGVDFGANLMSSPPAVLIDGAVQSIDEARHFDFSKWGLNGGDRFRGMEPLWLLKYLPNMPGCHIGIALDARGPNNSLTQDEASGGLVIAEAANIIRRGRADIMVTGTTGTKLHPVKACQHKKWDVLAEGPADQRCRPLDSNRHGEVLSEAACTLILESRSHAEARGAKIYGTILGTGASCVNSADGQADETQAVQLAAKMAMANAEVSAADLGHVNVSASGHLTRDAFEAKAIRTLLGDKAAETPVTAPKSYIGSAGSGSALTEIAISLLGLQHDVIPKTLNFQSTDDCCALNVVGNEHLATDNKLFLKTSVTRMGQSSAVVIGA
ncbi:beta-ketoacyl-[acyl-carrier-protein] synthase family protein [Fuerstiella marisgermanici]|uniref:3-oxoacyl-[acyl-carrier-protein] synthase 2 n=1 Tax=Fuerstiella marisgermanici TaxID=1891926 RepID=A0A1P8WI79_9PLAN|nr:beta-ketoacyl synthase N-terminal-like domain-containing protein [Fuerstiella marisgermanici]APZ93771.1 3-oxoacyl-[acyl-carrier-protein] synthase 2 [Fuerstiella marisgermanici]